MIISSNQIFLLQKEHTRNDTLKLIYDKAAELNVIDKKNINNLYLSLMKHEKFLKLVLLTVFLHMPQTDYIKNSYYNTCYEKTQSII